MGIMSRILHQSKQTQKLGELDILFFFLVLVHFRIHLIVALDGTRKWKCNR